MITAGTSRRMKSYPFSHCASRAGLIPAVCSQFIAFKDRACTFTLSPTTIQCSFWELEAVGARRATSSSASRVLRETRVSQSIVGTHSNAVTTEDAIAVRNLFGESSLIESKEPCGTNRRAGAVSLAQIRIN